MAVVSRGRAELPLQRWREPEMSPERKASVIYYLSREGQLEHPHFMELTLPSKKELRLRDVISRLNFLRGNGMGSLYSWSCKRSYKNGFVWHDVSEEDSIYPAQGQEYVLKGSEFLLKGGRRIRDAATQTENERRGWNLGEGEGENPTAELSCEEISPPPSSSSTETTEAIGKIRASASAVLLKLVSCGSAPVSLPGSRYSMRPRERTEEHYQKRKERYSEKEYFSGSLIETKNKAEAAGSAVILKRSTSCNADRGSMSVRFQN